MSNLSLNDVQTVNDSVHVKVESNPLLFSSKANVQYLLSNLGTSTKPEHDIAEIYVSLHLTLEIGIHTLFRHLFGMIGSMNSYDGTTFDENIDSIDFIHKVRMLMCVSKFTFLDKADVDKAKIYQKALIEDLQKFTHARNSLLHGHTISISGLENKPSKTKKKLVPSELNKQIEMFKKIIDMLTFFLDRMDSNVPKPQIKALLTAFLSTSFLPTITN